MSPELNVEFLKQCTRMIQVINFADYHTGRVYARLEHGEWTWRDAQRFSDMLEDHDAGAGLRAIGSYDDNSAFAANAGPPELGDEKDHTLGAWGADADAEAANASP